MIYNLKINTSVTAKMSYVKKLQLLFSAIKNRTLAILKDEQSFSLLIRRFVLDQCIENGAVM
jgi:hypothetical protein